MDVDGSEDELFNVRDHFLNTSQEIVDCLSTGRPVPLDMAQRWKIPKEAEDDSTKAIKKMIESLYHMPSFSARLSLSPNRVPHSVSPGDVRQTPCPLFTSTPMPNSRYRMPARKLEGPPRLQMETPPSSRPVHSRLTQTPPTFMGRLKNSWRDPFIRNNVKKIDFVYLIIFFSLISLTFLLFYPVRQEPFTPV